MSDEVFAPTDEVFAAWCRHQWQTHEARVNWPGTATLSRFSASIGAGAPRRRTIGSDRAEVARTALGPAQFRTLWPLLAKELLIADWKCEAAAAESDLYEQPIEYFDPPKLKQRDWRQLYAAELHDHPSLLAALGHDISPVGSLLLQCNVTPREQDVVWRRLAGNSWAEIAEDLGVRSTGSVVNLWNRALERIRLRFLIEDEVATG